MGWPRVRRGGGVGRVDLLRIVAAAVELPDLVVGQVRDHREQLRVLPEEVLARVGAAAHLVVLVVAVDGLVHALDAAGPSCPSRAAVPAPAPDHLEHVPAGAAEGAFEFLDDLAVAAHGAVEALQVAVHHEDQVVELLARRERDRAERLGLVHLAVAQEHPHLAIAGVEDAAVLAGSGGSAPGRSPMIGPRPIETVGNCQNSGISQGCGYDESPRPSTSRRKLRSCSSLSRPSR